MIPGIADRGICRGADRQQPRALAVANSPPLIRGGFFLFTAKEIRRLVSGLVLRNALVTRTGYGLDFQRIEVTVNRIC